MTTKKPTMLERCGVTCGDDAAQWDELVQMLLGPKLLSDSPERRRRHALAIAAAALRAAGQKELAANVEQDKLAAAT
ncbi:TPA: hypothetical protein L5C62_005391 [Pseudomonas aeruginosa]|uniref:hypothetical protein n=2 Tax=Pseudomonas aeruginosa TaxID=287 RepID=UPI0007A8F728|nr:hypothetical protein [Pseudomonas aeruginosa]EKX2112997.1 hypothetical protein [Pseudomonas aeruginosa]EKY4187232.1 hypothetical protein [Pseudomonas aeruginosa]ELT3988956.1 hypothetical protein [Pseudomonas aeruginosa]KYO86225.1 hypothetical protein LL05_03449 [Pseudomonas aeruginosa]MBG4833890.1 hypothetical protein [Pseudomonas aeruginosa]